MGFLDRYQEWARGVSLRKAQKLAERQVVLEQARQEWVGCRVWCVFRSVDGPAWVTEISDEGAVSLHLEEPSGDHLEFWVAEFEMLGKEITHVQ